MTATPAPARDHAISYSGRRWWETAVVYQLYVRSFADANNDGIGDLAGIRSRLGYLRDLGVDAIWLNPCYPSPQFDHGYDVADYFDIEPDYGTLAEFDGFVAEAREHGIRVMMDVVPNHCSWDHAWFKAAIAAGPGSAERDRFWFRDGRGPNGDEPPNDWPAIFSGSAWNRVTEPDGTPGQWYLGLFTPQQPDFNWHDPDVNEHFDRMLRFWFDRGVDGFRVDATTVVGKAPGLPDLGPLLETLGLTDANPHTTWRPEGHEVWRRWRKVVDAYQLEHPERDLVLIAEAYTANRPDIFREYVNDAEFHSAFSFDLMLAAWSTGELRAAIDDTRAVLTPIGLLPAWTLNNHDAQRSVTRYGRADATESTHSTNALDNSTAAVDLVLGTHRARAAALFELALPGSVYLYAGEELGLPEVLDLPDADREDPVFLRTNGASLGRDGCRVPLPWTTDASTNFGFSARATPDGPATDGPATDSAATDSATGEPWLPQPASFAALSVAATDGHEASVLSMYRSALALRRTHAALTADDFGWIDAGYFAEQLLVFSRGDVVVVLNIGSTPAPIDTYSGKRRVLLSSLHGHDDPTIAPPNTCLWLAP